MSVFCVALRLGLTSFGGPVAHLEYFRREYVEKQKWLDEDEFADLVTMSQVLPGPASSQLGMAIGLRRGGLAGGFAAWLGFTLPSALIMTLVGLLATRPAIVESGWVHGLKLGAIAVVVMAIISLARSTLKRPVAIAIAVVSAVVTIAMPTALTHIVVIALGAVVGRILIPIVSVPRAGMNTSRRPWLPLALLVIFFMGFSVLTSPLGQLLGAIYRAGILVFGGGHVVLPLLEAGVVREGLLDADTFLAGYGAAQAIPGPLFTFASYLGAVTFGGWGALLATIVIFLPGALLVIAVLPYWSAIRANASMRGAINGANAAVVGVLASVPFLPITRTSIDGPLDLVIIAIALGALLSKRVPVLAIIAVSAALGFAIAQ